MEKDPKVALIEFVRKDPVIPFRSLLGWFLPERRCATVAEKSLNAFAMEIMKEYRAN